MPRPTPKTLISSDQISSRISELAEEVTRDYSDENRLVIVGVLKGSFVFLADLVREIDLDLEIEMISVMSYGAATKSSGQVRLIMDLQRDIRGRDVLIVEDIVDTGRTLNYLLGNLAHREPRSLRVCTLLDKPSRREVEANPDYVGFEIPDKFVVGYGLDHAERYRGLPNIATLDQ